MWRRPRRGGAEPWATLSRVCGQYLEDLDAKDLSLSIRNGVVELHDLRVKRDALDQLGLPLSIVQGSGPRSGCGSVSCSEGPANLLRGCDDILYIDFLLPFSVFVAWPCVHVCVLLYVHGHEYLCVV